MELDSHVSGSATLELHCPKSMRAFRNMVRSVVENNSNDTEYSALFFRTMLRKVLCCLLLFRSLVRTSTEKYGQVRKSMDNCTEKYGQVRARGEEGAALNIFWNTPESNHSL